MAIARGKRLAIICAAAALLALGTAAFLARGALLERWWIHRLASEDRAAAAAAAVRLGDCGGPRAARALLDDLRRHDTVGDPAVEVLEKIYPRVGEEVRVAMVEGLLEVLTWMWEESRRGTANRFEPEHLTSEALSRFLARHGPETKAALPAFDRALKGPIMPLSAIVLGTVWPDSGKFLHRFLEEAEPERCAEMYYVLWEIAVEERRPWMEDLEKWPETRARDIAVHFFHSHERPEARALSLAFSLWGEIPVQNPESLGILDEALRRDPHPLVRSAAARIAGRLGPIPGNLDLPSLLLDEKDPRLLLEVIQARAVWGIPGSEQPPVWKFELWDGFSFPYLSSRTEEVKPWDDRELERLRQIRLEVEDPALRQAASQVLTYLERSREARPPEPRQPFR